MVYTSCGSIDSFGHELIEFLIGNFILRFAGLLHHQFQHFLIVILTENLTDLFYISSGYVSFAFPVIFFEDVVYLSVPDFIFGLGGHCCHELVE